MTNKLIFLIFSAVVVVAAGVLVWQFWPPAVSMAEFDYPGEWGDLKELDLSDEKFLQRLDGLESAKKQGFDIFEASSDKIKEVWYHGPTDIIVYIGKGIRVDLAYVEGETNVETLGIIKQG
ncbi:hypothetical protein KJ616_01825 [Patescibacteria group bacterium]|nr:hypothetical protein [Patescibacteria group bacterium]